MMLGQSKVPHVLLPLLPVRCFCAPLPDKPDHWTFVTGAKIPTETDLRKEVSQASNKRHCDGSQHPCLACSVAWQSMVHLLSLMLRH